MIKLFEKLFCRHDYEYYDQYKVDGGMAKIVRHKCKKCGKFKVYIV